MCSIVIPSPLGDRGRITNSSSRVTGMVSVIIPNFNHAQYIGDAIRSVLDQDYLNSEIIVVDDGSTDSSREIVAQFGSQVRYIWQENRGLPAARNTGIKTARGEYIGLLDADDIYEPEFMSTLVSFLEANPDAEGVYCGYQFVDHLNNPLPQRETRLVPDAQLFQSLVDGNFLVPESILVRRRCYEEVGLFDETLSACEDMDMWLRITSQHKIVGTPKSLTRHRILPNSMSSDPVRQMQNRLAVIRKHFGSEPNIISRSSKEQRRAYGQAYLASTVEFLQAQMLENAFKCFSRMTQISPQILSQLNTYYELGCGDQPKGFRGDFESLNMEKNAQILMEMLNRLFDDPQLSGILSCVRAEAYANAYFALGLLCYGGRKFRKARKFFLLTLKTNPKFADHRLFALYLKSLLGARIVSFIHQIRLGSLLFDANN